MQDTPQTEQQDILGGPFHPTFPSPFPALVLLSLSLSSMLPRRASSVGRHTHVTAAPPLLSLLFFSPYRSRHLSHFSEMYSSLGTFSAMLGVATASWVMGGLSTLCVQARGDDQTVGWYAMPSYDEEEEEARGDDDARASCRQTPSRVPTA
jgi:hypothetical protein